MKLGTAALEWVVLSMPRTPKAKPTCLGQGALELGTLGGSLRCTFNPELDPTPPPAGFGARGALHKIRLGPVRHLG